MRIMMMLMPSCRDVTLSASDYLDSHLSWMRRLRVRMHLAMCDACPAMLRELRAIASGMRRLPSVALSAARRTSILRAGSAAPPSV